MVDGNNIVFCTNVKCEKASTCFRNLLNEKYPKESGAMIQAFGGCNKYEMYIEIRK